MPEKSFLSEFDDSAKYRLDLMPVQIIANNENFLMFNILRAKKVVELLLLVYFIFLLFIKRPLV